jgi:hypothetical protein
MYLDNQYKKFPFSYYCPQIIEEFKESLSKKFEQLTIENELPKVLTFAEEIELKIKTKYNLLLPAVFLEIKAGEQDIAFDREDLKKVSMLFSLVFYESR